MMGVLYNALFFTAAVLICFDLINFGKNRAGSLKTGDAVLWSFFWLFLSFLFIPAVYFFYESSSSDHSALEFFNCFIIEKCLAAAGVWAMTAILSTYSISVLQHASVVRVAIALTVLLRIGVLFFGMLMIKHFSWSLHLLAVFFVFSGFHFLIRREPNRSMRRKRLERNRALLEKSISWAPSLPLMAAAQIVAANLNYALDAVPAAFAMTRDPFILWSSNMFAMMGMRSLYDAIAPVVHKTRFVQYGMGGLFIIVGITAVLPPQYSLPYIFFPLLFFFILLLSLGATWLFPEEAKARIRPVFLEKIDRAAFFSLKQARKVVVLILGTTVLLIGLALIVLPGPAMIVIPLGLFILSSEFSWARNLMHKIGELIKRGKR